MPLLRRLSPALVWALIASASASADDALNTSGARVYKQACARCHGENGEGTKKHFPHPLAGEKSAENLLAYIAKEMPEDRPGSLSVSDAKAVSTFVYTTFYSKAARIRNAPPRIELSRLTVRQYRNSVADLIGSFRNAPQWGEIRGLRGEYFNSREFQSSKLLIDRTEPEVKFDFGTEGPEPEKFDSFQFSIRYSGSVMAPESGEYDFIVRTDHALRLWVNDDKTPLIDAWVKSGKDTEFRGTITLLAGRAYPIKLEFSKAKQGVDDSKKAKKPPPTPAFIELLWKRPRQVAEMIPSRYLAPTRFPESFVVTTPFPPDDRSVGWERGTSISKAWDQATTDAAIETASYVVSRFNEFSGRGGRTVKAQEFCQKFAERAFRRPLTPELKKAFIEQQFADGRDVDLAVKRVVLMVLKSPRFLYREVGHKPDAYDVASRLSFGLWDSLPDRELLEAAAKGKLSTRDEVVKQAERMLNDLRARAKMREFLLTWLKVDPAPDLAKTPGRFPGFDAATVADLRASLELFLNDVMWSESSDFQQLLLADSLFLNGRLAKLYGIELPAGTPFQKVSMGAKERAGVLTHPYLMATFAYSATSSPIHRGVFLARSVLGQALRPPPEAFAPLAPELAPELTTRERISLQTKPQACQSCHNMINPLGFTLENYDAVGRFRKDENGKPIDSTGGYHTRSGAEVKFANVRDLATFLANSPEVHDAFVEQVFHHLVQQPVRAYGASKPDELRRAFEKSGFNIRKLMVEIMAAAALQGNTK